MYLDQNCVCKYIHKEVGICSFYNYSGAKQCVFLKTQEYWVMWRIRPLTALWKGGLYIFDYFQKLCPFLQQSWTPYWLISFLSQQKLLLRRDFIRKCFDILLFWNRSEWWNKTFKYICTIQVLQLFLLLLHFKTHGRKC